MLQVPNHVKIVRLLFTTVAIYNGVFSYDTVFELKARNFTEVSVGCDDYPSVEHGNTSLTHFNGLYTLHFSCSSGYKLVGWPKLHCKDGHWDSLPRPECVPVVGCSKPALLLNGGVEIDGMEERGMYAEGVVARYECSAQFSLVPPTAGRRVCRDGHWTGLIPQCVLTGCDASAVVNGYREPILQHYPPGAVVRFGCNEGFSLAGPPRSVCLGRSQWSSALPHCSPKQDPKNVGCESLPLIAHVVATLLPGDRPFMLLHCADGYVDPLSPCRSQLLHCHENSWRGRIPVCVEASGCLYPPNIPHGSLLGLESGRDTYPPGAQVVYTCLPGYTLEGSPVLCCRNGCWKPDPLPTCRPHYYGSAGWEELLSSNAPLLISLVTGLSVALILAAVCTLVMCRRPLPASPPPNATFTPHLPPDRLSLIAFADTAVQQSVLPSYEEAVRGSAGSLLSYRLHRHWTPLQQQRRNRHTSLSVGGGDSMGSTDTMTISDVSTVVTVDTTSSASNTSQTASCRAISGSLASFDTSSILNTEGVPLLEASEVTALAAPASNISTKFQSDVQP